MYSRSPSIILAEGLDPAPENPAETVAAPAIT